jgi:hypothetical protein
MKSKLISGKRTAEDLVRAHLEKQQNEPKKPKRKRKPSPTTTEKPTPATGVESPESYLVLPSNTHGSYSYPDLLVSKDRRHKNSNWNQAHKALSKEDSFMLTIRQFVDLLALLKSSNPLYDGRGNPLHKDRVEELYADITEVRDPYRAEWLDAKFTETGRIRSKWELTYHKIKPDGTSEEVIEQLQECLMDDKTPGIDLDYLLNNATDQGLPPKNNSEGSLYYWHPRKERVARFRADSDWAFLDCNWDPLYSNSELGVRAAKIKRN